MKRSSRLIRIFIKALVVLLLSTPLILVLLALETRPRIDPLAAPDSAEMTRVEQLLVQSAPRGMDTASRQAIDLGPDDLNLLLRYGIEVLQVEAPLGGRFELSEGSLKLDGSAPLLGSPFPVWLNISATLKSDKGMLTLERLQAGQLSIPGALVAQMVSRLRRYYMADTQAFEDISALLASVQDIRLDHGRLQFELHWDPALLTRIRDQSHYYLVSAEDRQRILNHYRLLGAILDAIPPANRAISLNALLVPMFAAAHQVSLNGGNAIAENRTLLMTLAMYVNGADVARLVGPSLSQNLPPVKEIEVRVQRRQDLAQHIVSSAAITASAGAGIARVLSSTKEAYDARYRSGFSFSDLTANLAGVALGTLATASDSSAAMIQARMLTLNSELEYLPEVTGNRDGLSETDFNQLYRDNPDEYQRRLEDIEALINDLPMFRAL